MKKLTAKSSCQALVLFLLATTAFAAGPAKNPDAEATVERDMKSYKTTIAGTEATYEMVPIPSGEYLIGSPASEAGRKEDEGPQVAVKIEPFWMGKFEVSWDEYDVWSYNLDIQRRKLLNIAGNDLDPVADAVTRPTKPYTDMTFGMGHDGYPAICMTQLAAKTYCEWLSQKTGHYYRLPTEAEWEYACRAGTKTAYSFGDDAAKLGDYSWNYDNSDEKYHKIGLKKPNPWGLHDMHGNVSEWCLDGYEAGFYKQLATKGGVSVSPMIPATKLYPRSARGGSWDADADECRSASRVISTKDWKQQDPQVPKSKWYMTDALQVGFRLVRPLRIPSAEERLKLNLAPEKDIERD